VVLLAIWDCEVSRGARRSVILDGRSSSPCLDSLWVKNHEFTTTTRVAELPYRGAPAAEDVGEGEQNRATPDLQGTTRRKARSNRQIGMPELDIRRGACSPTSTRLESWRRMGP